MKVRNGGGEETPLVQSKEQRLHFAGAAVKRYPTSEIRDRGLECQALTAQEWLRGATPHLRPGAVPEARGGSQKEQPHA